MVRQADSEGPLPSSKRSSCRFIDYADLVTPHCRTSSLILQTGYNDWRAGGLMHSRQGFPSIPDARRLTKGI